MPRPLSPEREKEYGDLRAFLDFYFKHLLKNAPVGGLDLATEARKIADQFGKSKGLEGLRQAVGDVLEEFRDLTPDSVKMVDEALRAVGLITLSELRRKYDAAYRKILKRRSIKSETEYYLVNGLLVDQTSEVSPSERTLLQEMVEAYETVVNRPLHQTAFGVD